MTGDHFSWCNLANFDLKIQKLHLNLSIFMIILSMGQKRQISITCPLLVWHFQWRKISRQEKYTNEWIIHIIFSFFLGDFQRKEKVFLLWMSIYSRPFDDAYKRGVGKFNLFIMNLMRKLKKIVNKDVYFLS